MDESPQTPTPELSPVHPTNTEREPTMHRIFVGPSGIRAGWRFFIYIAAFIVLQIVISLILRPLFPPSSSHQPPRLRVFLLAECLSLLTAIVPAIFMARVENRAFDVYGLPRRRAFDRHFWSGLLWGIVAITVLLASMRGIGVFQFGGLALHGLTVLKFAAFWAVLFIVVGLFEEFVIRGYSLFTLADGIGFWPAALLLSFAFGALHFPQEYLLGDKWGAWAGVLGAASIGLFFCLTLRRTGTLWFAVGMHASWDWGETFFYSVPDSGLKAPGHLLKTSFHGVPWLTGGPVGPEASVLVFVLIAALWVLFNYLYPDVKYRGGSVSDHSYGSSSSSL